VTFVTTSIQTDAVMLWCT